MKDRFIKVAVIVLTVLLGIQASSPINIEADVNTALTLINELNKYTPQEPYSVEPPLSTLGSYARFLLYVEKLEKEVETNSAILPEWVSTTLNNYQDIRNKLNVGNWKELIEKVINQASNQTLEILTNVKNSQNKEVLYAQNSEALRQNIRIWADTIRLYRDEGGLDDLKFEEYTKEFNQVYDVILQLNDISGLNLNLGFIRPDETYDMQETITRNMMDSAGNLRIGYLDIFTLSSFSDNTRLDAVISKLPSSSRGLYDMYYKYRTPLYTGNEKEPIKALYESGSKSVKISSLREFIDNPENEVVLYLPIYEKDKSTPVEELTDKVNLTDYYPIYIKGNKNTLVRGVQHFMSGKNEGKKLPSYSTAMMNYMQYINFREAGKMNDYSLDLAYPLFIDVWGNIQTYSGKIVVPSIANMNYRNNNIYFPLNAYFLNNYPIESTDSSLAELLKNNSKNYAIWCNLESVDSKDSMYGVVSDTSLQSRHFQMVQFEKSGGLKKPSFTGLFTNEKDYSALPVIEAYIEELDNEGKLNRTPFMQLVTKNQGSWWGLNEYKILGLKESVLKVNENNSISFMFINDSIPVNIWNLNYLYGNEGDKRKLDNELLVKIAESCYNNPDVDFLQFKIEDGESLSYGYKMGAFFEPIHKNLSESLKNYNLYTPSIAELPLLTDYISTLLIPLLKILMLFSVVLIIVKYVRNFKSMSIVNVAVSLLVVYLINQGITTFYPAILNTGFNGLPSYVLGKNAYNLSLYNIEKDLNSKGEFVYGEGSDEKIVSSGAYIKLSELDKDEVKQIRALQEEAPYKEGDYYVPDWDTTPVYISNNLFIKGTSLYIHVKSLTASTNMVYRFGEYQNLWEQMPDYSFYTPYLSILDGLLKSINTYSISNGITPKTMVYSTGNEMYTGMALSYFTSRYFLVDNESANKADLSFKEKWELYNKGDFLNLKNVLYLEPDSKYFPSSYESRVKESRWYQVASKISNKDLEKKILDVNLKTKSYIFDILPYMNNISDEILLKMIALYATVEFNKEFSTHIPEFYEIRDLITEFFKGNLNYDLKNTLYPKRLELDSITMDEQIKISLINTSDLLKFNVTSVYKFVENQSSWFGMLLLGINSLLLFIRSLMRIVLISVTIVIVLLYALVVYALRRDYSNKTIIGLLNIIVLGWLVYLIDSILTVIFVGFDKTDAGTLLIILICWLLWNLVATSIYMLIFNLIFKDVSAFGGNIVFGATSTMLNGANSVIKAGLGVISKTKAEHFDITRPDLESASQSYEDYLNQDIEMKLEQAQENIKNTVLDKKEELLSKRQSKYFTLKEAYSNAKFESSEHPDTPIIIKVSKLSGNKVRNMAEYFETNGISVTDKNDFINLSGDSKNWDKILKDNTIKSEDFGYSVVKNNDIFFKNTTINKENLKRGGINYDTIDKDTIRVKNDAKINDIVEGFKKDLYRVLIPKIEAVRLLEGKTEPFNYRIGNKYVYMTDKDEAEKFFSGKYNLAYETTLPFKDNIDKLDGNNVVENLDAVCGMWVSNEFIYGTPTHLLEDLPINHIAKEIYKFNPQDRVEIIKNISNNAYYLENDDYVSFSSETPIDDILCSKESIDNVFNWGVKDKKDENIESIQQSETDIFDLDL